MLLTFSGRRKLFYALTVLSFAPAACTKKPAEKEKAVLTITGERGMQLAAEPPAYPDSAFTEQEILSHLQKRTGQVSDMAKQATPEKANELWQHFRQENDSAIALLSARRATLLDEFMQYGDYDPKTETFSYNFPAGVAEVVKNYDAAGLQFWEIGEGMTTLRMQPDFYFKIFNGRLTPDHQRYLELQAKEDRELFQADAAILIPWREVARRVEEREKFLTDFSKSTLKPKVTEELTEYRYAYLWGYDNTQTHERGVFTRENKAEFLRFQMENPHSETTLIISEMLSKKWTPEALHEFIMTRIGYTI